MNVRTCVPLASLRFDVDFLHEIEHCRILVLIRLKIPHEDSGIVYRGAVLSFFRIEMNGMNIPQGQPHLIE